MKKVPSESYALYQASIFIVNFLAIRGPKALQDAWDKQKTVHQK